jgi:hypothetical protein
MQSCPFCNFRALSAKAAAAHQAADSSKKAATTRGASKYSTLDAAALRNARLEAFGDEDYWIAVTPQLRKGIKWLQL